MDEPLLPRVGGVIREFVTSRVVQFVVGVSATAGGIGDIEKHPHPVASAVIGGGIALVASVLIRVIDDLPD